MNNTFPRLAFIGIIFFLVSVLPMMAQDLFIANGTGEIISEIQIRPSKKAYPKDKNVCVFQNLTLNDKETFTVNFPSTMRGMDSFDVVLKYGKKTAKTKKSVTILRQGENVPKLIANIDGKPSSIPYAFVGAGGIAAGAGAAVATTAISAGGVAVVNFAAAGTTIYGGAAIVSTLTAIGGGSLATGVGVIVAVPVLTAAGILAAINLFSDDTLILVQVF